MNCNLEIILCDINKSYLDDLLIKELEVFQLPILSSHFFDNRRKIDIELSDIKSFLDVFNNPNTGHIYFSYLTLGAKINNVVIVLSFDESTGDIVINFPCQNMINKNSYKSNLKIIVYLQYLLKKYSIPEIRLGYEPAYDEDMTLYVLTDFNQDASYIVRKILSN